MEIRAGTRFGPYEVLSLLGAGGMGEVYRARDTRLDRTVALKVLSPRVAAGTEARERFEREARAISSLNHPNICALYDVGNADGTEYLVMELVDGQSLAERLTRGALPLDQVLRYGAEIAGALAKAHRQGIVHRDLKPGNVMITKTGAKLLDFGLARRMSGPAVVGHDAPTAKALTSEGTILGTLQYMAPEQLEGSATDARTDIFAFGALLYEMATGTRAFHASSSASLITKIMSEQPSPIGQVQPMTPPALERLIRRALAKDPDERWQSADDIESELRWIAESGGTVETPATRRRSLLPWIVAAGCVLLAIGAVVAKIRTPAAETRTLRFVVNPPPDSKWVITVLWNGLAVSPDGTRIAVIVRSAQPGSGDALAVHDLRDGSWKSFAGSAPATAPFWSPDSQSVGFFSQGKLKTLTLADSVIQQVCDVAAGSWPSGTWSSDGTIVFVELTGTNDSVGIRAVPATGGTPRLLLERSKGLLDVAVPQFIPGTRSFFFLGFEKKSNSVWIGDLDGGAPRKILEKSNRVEYVAPYALFSRDATLFAQRFDARKAVLEGPAVSVGDFVHTYNSTGISQHSASSDVLAYYTSRRRHRIVWIDRSGLETEAMPPDAVTEVRLSPDGKRAMLAIRDERTSATPLWVADLQKRSKDRFTFELVNYSGPVWSADGRSVAFTADVEAPDHVFVKSFTETAMHRVTTPGPVQYVNEWLPDGRILYEESSAATRLDLYLIRPGGKPEVWLQTPFNESNARHSPDGRWLVYVSDETGQPEVFVAPLDRRTERARVSKDGGTAPMWSRDGRTIFYQAGTREIFGATVVTRGEAIEIGDPAHVLTTSRDIAALDVGPGDRFLASLTEITPTASPIEVVVNWRAEVEKLLAAKR